MYGILQARLGHPRLEGASTRGMTTTSRPVATRGCTSLPFRSVKKQLGANVVQGQRRMLGVRVHAAHRHTWPPPEQVEHLPTDAPADIEYDAIIIGSGVGGLSTGAQLVTKGAKVLVLEKYLVPGGSAGAFQREGYTFDVGSSIMFGFGDKGSTNLLTRCLAAVGKKLPTVPDPTQVHYHLPPSATFPEGWTVQVWRSYELFLADLTSHFPHEADGIKAFYDDCWTVFNALNVLELRSLEHGLFLLTQLVQQPRACVTLLFYVGLTAGDVARKHIKDPELLKFIDLECFLWATVTADYTPMISAGMLFSDRHYGGIHYPIGGVGKIPQTLADGIVEHGGHVVYKANVKEIVTEPQPDGSAKATGVRLADGRVFRGKTVVSNATRWDTFEHLLPGDKMPEDEKLFRQRYKKAPSFFSLHLGVDASVFQAQGDRPAEDDCHHIILEDWAKMEAPHGCLFVSLPSLLDPTLAPPGKHIVHAFTPDWIDNWQGLSIEEYEAKKEAKAADLIKRMSKVWPTLEASVTFKEVGTPRTHRRFLNRDNGTYGPIPARRPFGMLSMPFNTTSVPGLYCAGDSTFPGQGVNAVVFSGFGAAHRIASDLGLEPRWAWLDKAVQKLLAHLRDRS